MPRRLHKLALLLLALTLYPSSSNGSGFAAATCPLPFLKVKMDSEIVGRSVKVTYSITNRGDEEIQDMAIRIGLPSLSVADNAKASSSYKSSSQVIQPGSAVYWLNVDLRRRKRLRFTVKTQLKARLCTAQTINFSAFAYLVNPIDGSASCPSAAATIDVYVKGRSSKRRHCPATPSPTVTPSLATLTQSPSLAPSPRPTTASPTLLPTTRAPSRSPSRQPSSAPTSVSPSLTSFVRLSQSKHYLTPLCMF